VNIRKFIAKLSDILIIARFSDIHAWLKLSEFHIYLARLENKFKKAIDFVAKV
jgi:hypothetical protein